MEKSEPLSKSLYECLGGAERIQAIVSDAVELHLVNPVNAPRFQNYDIPRLKQLAVEFFGAGTGGPEGYTGHDKPTAHAGMNISERENMATTEDIANAIENNGVEFQERNKVIAVLYSLKGQIIPV